MKTNTPLDAIHAYCDYCGCNIINPNDCQNNRCCFYQYRKISRDGIANDDIDKSIRQMCSECCWLRNDDEPCLFTRCLLSHHRFSKRPGIVEKERIGKVTLVG